MSKRLETILPHFYSFSVLYTVSATARRVQYGRNIASTYTIAPQFTVYYNLLSHQTERPFLSFCIIEWK
jgi:hypothetical protein